MGNSHQKWKEVSVKRQDKIAKEIRATTTTTKEILTSSYVMELFAFMRDRQLRGVLCSRFIPQLMCDDKRLFGIK